MAFAAQVTLGDARSTVMDRLGFADQGTAVTRGVKRINSFIQQAVNELVLEVDWTDMVQELRIPLIHGQDRYEFPDETQVGQIIEMTVEDCHGRRFPMQGGIQQQDWPGKPNHHHHTPSLHGFVHDHDVSHHINHNPDHGPEPHHHHNGDIHDPNDLDVGNGEHHHDHPHTGHHHHHHGHHHRGWGQPLRWRYVDREIQILPAPAHTFSNLVITYVRRTPILRDDGDILPFDSEAIVQRAVVHGKIHYQQPGLVDTQRLHALYLTRIKAQQGPGRVFSVGGRKSHYVTADKRVPLGPPQTPGGYGPGGQRIGPYSSYDETWNPW